MAKHDYIFVDESGDPGYKVDPDSGQLLSSNFYIAAALHLSDDAFAGLNRHMAAFRYYSGLNRELKIPPSREEFSRLLGPVKVMAEAGADIRASVVYLDKLKYNGRFLKGSKGRPPEPVRFRNYIIRRLLEHHFHRYDPLSSQYDLVIDRVPTTREEMSALRNSLIMNERIPNPAHITHASSIYVEGLQVVHHIANGFQGAVNCQGVPPELSYVSARDITIRQRIF